ncbi:prepilin peptidase [uncultured Photobacterium sp.]|uniref:A24 family peptidase n=1 Tax=uncultured Photobacterium sp. TaxID=173973 RepID=UPI00263520E2|nr:prepilin peptidase [uncultured Photobacterium sp.]
MIFALISLLFIVSVQICYKDITHRTISNKAVGLVLILCLLISLKVSLLGDSIGYATLIVVIGFVVSICGVIGGGDIKLLTAYSLAINPNYLSLVFISIGFIGGLQAIYTIGISTIIRKQSVKHQEGLPYGVPISISCILGIILTVLTSNI